jgi:thioredoxin 1
MRTTTEPPVPTAVAATFASLVLDAPGPVAVEFMSYGCGHCRAIEPAVQAAALSLGAAEHIVRVNVAVEHDLADAYDIRVTPTFVMFRDAHEVGRIEGPEPRAASLLAALRRPFAA